MADFALGLAKTAVEGTLSRVQSAIEEEGKLKVTVQHDLVFITGEFQMMQSFLKVASKERANNEVVKTWVRQLRDLALDVEDCVEFVVHLDNSSTWSWLWRVLPSFMAPPRHLDHVVAEMKQLKARVEDVSHRNARYNLISDSGSKHVSSPTPPAEASFDILREIWEVEGKRCTMDGLQRLITTEGDGRQVISVWEGTGGDIGAASILRKLYSDQIVCNKFRRCAWVKLVHPFNPDEFLQSMLTQFCSQDPTKCGDDFPRRVRAALAVEDDVMKARELEQLLSEQTYLVILEDVSTVVEWNFFSSFLPKSKHRSRIVVSTKQLKIATLSTGEPNQVLKLSSDQPLFVFLHKEFAKSNGFGGGEVSHNRLEEAHECTKKILPFWPPDEAFCVRKLLNVHGVTSVWGIAGLGKSSLVRSEYYKSLILVHGKPVRNVVMNYFTNQFRAKYEKYSWVDVPSPFNLAEFARRLFLDFHSDDCQAKQTAAIGMVEGQDPIQGCRKILAEGKCLVVIDDLRSEEDWDMIKAAFLPHLRSGDSAMVVITSQPTVARRCVMNDESKMVNIKGLHANAAFLLFKKKVWGEDCDLTPEEEELSKGTVARCGGLATVIFSIGNYCSKAKLETEPRRETKCLLKDINSDFINKLETHPDLQHLFSWIRSYFDACSDSVKPCVFYLSVFPSGSKIRRRRLIRRWIAEDYSRDTPGSTAEENAANLFSELVSLSIIQKTRSKVISQVNTFLHEYIISQPMEDNLVFALEGSCSPNTQRSGRHLTIRSSWHRDINVFKSIDFSRLRSLTVLGEWSPFFISDKFGMRVLRVLDLEGSVGVTYHVLQEIGRLLPRLKFISLRGCRQIKQLPDSFGGLRQLQTLDVRHTSIVMLPPVIFQIEKLQYIRAGTSSWHADDDMLTTVPVVYEDQTSAPLPTPRDAHDDTTPVPPAVDGDHTSQTAQQDGDGSLPQQDHDETARILPAVDRDRASPQQEDSHHPSTQGQANPPQAAQKNKTWPSWLRFSKKSKPCASAHNEGVDDVPAAAGIGKLMALHTIGVINVNGPGGNKASLEELKKLTQLRKLSVSGINSRNIKDLLSSISGYRHLESLSLRLDEDAFPDGISLPKPVTETLKSFQLHGNLKKLPASWIKQLDNLRKLKLELTVSGQEDFDALRGLLGVKTQVVTRLCVKLSQGGKISFDNDGPLSLHRSLAVFEIDCISSSEVTFELSMMYFVELLKVRCSKEASFTFSGLKNLYKLKEVWLMGAFDDKLKQEMQQQLGKHGNKPVLKLLKEYSS